MGYGAKQLALARGVDVRREQIGLHVSEIMEALEHAAPPEGAGVHADYGPVKTITGVTRRMRAVRLLVQGDRLPMTLVAIDADVEALLVRRECHDGGRACGRVRWRRSRSRAASRAGR